MLFVSQRKQIAGLDQDWFLRQAESLFFLQDQLDAPKQDIVTDAEASCDKGKIEIGVLVLTKPIGHGSVDQ